MGVVVQHTEVLRNIVFDESGQFVSGEHVHSISAAGNYTLSLRVTGDPGSYWLTVKVKTPVPTYKIEYPPPQYITLKGGHFDLFIDLPPFHDAPPGTYTFDVYVANQWLGALSIPVTKD